jgi:hypothetical protein
MPPFLHKFDARVNLHLEEIGVWGYTPGARHGHNRLNVIGEEVRVLDLIDCQQIL